jgi:hypothetical protein
LEGLYLSNFHPDKIKANPKVIEFYKSFENNVIEDVTILDKKEISFSDYQYKEADKKNTTTVVEPIQLTSQSSIKVIKYK